MELREVNESRRHSRLGLNSAGKLRKEAREVRKESSFIWVSAFLGSRLVCDRNGLYALKPADWQSSSLHRHRSLVTYQEAADDWKQQELHQSQLHTHTQISMLGWQHSLPLYLPWLLPSSYWNDFTWNTGFINADISSLAFSSMYMCRENSDRCVLRACEQMWTLHPRTLPFTYCPKVKARASLALISSIDLDPPKPAYIWILRTCT